MNKKQTSTLLLTALLSLSSVTPALASSATTTSMPTFSNATTNPMQSIVQEASDKKLAEGLEERKVALYETINGEEFADMSLNERMGFVRDYFTVRSDVYKEKQKTVISSTDILQLEEMKNKIVLESDKEDKDTALISKLITEIQSADMSKLKAEDVKALEMKLQEMIASYQDLRSAGRSLEQLVSTQIKVFNSSQLQILNKFSQKMDVNGEKEKALDMNLNMLQLTNGDVEVMKKVISMLKADGKDFFFVDNKVVELSVPTISKNGGVYIDISDFAKVDGFTVKNDKKALVIRNGENVLVVNKESNQAQFNKQSIGKGITFVEEGKLYIPLRSVLNLFHYEVKWSETVEQIVVTKQVYAKNELEMMKPEELTKGLFPEIKEEPKQKKEDKKEKPKPTDS